MLYRLKDAGFIAYLVGGSVRDLLLGRRPKDFDIGTSAHPYQVKRLFRNCWIIGRRFRLAHVSSARRSSRSPRSAGTSRRRSRRRSATEAEGAAVVGSRRVAARRSRRVERDLLIRRDNTFGTPEEDAFRRDFTINALFYDIATFSIIDYVGGLRDLQDGVIRCIGDPDERFREDPVRMLRAVAFAERLGFTLDPPVERAIRRHRREIARSAPRAPDGGVLQGPADGRTERVFRTLARLGLLEAITPELQRRGVATRRCGSRWQRLDAFRGAVRRPCPRR